jgi:hypothetical protein
MLIGLILSEFYRYLSIYIFYDFNSNFNLEKFHAESVYSKCFSYKIKKCATSKSFLVYISHTVHILTFTMSKNECTQQNTIIYKS